MEVKDTNVRILGCAGGSGARPFTFYHPGQSLSRLDACASDECVKGIWATLTDHQCATLGTRVGDHRLECKSYQFEPDEKLTELTIWESQDGDRIGRIEFKTDRCGAFMIGPGGGKKHRFEVSKSKPLGLAGQYGADITRFALIVTKEDTVNEV
ncbi:aerolysin-like protein [Ptychodera flava]|uniref:aerolysin-like protein n=1 Tax=Ptychodera flava TaxID=63121 RepID=UPI003969C252